MKLIFYLVKEQSMCKFDLKEEKSIGRDLYIWTGAWSFTSVILVEILGHCLSTYEEATAAGIRKNVF